MELTDIIIEKIKKEGPLSFHDFMEMSLYYPGLGYYTSPGNKTGKSGDYFTSPHVTGLFGNMIGRQLEEMWLLMGKNEFTIVEYGGGTGMLCQDILDHCKANDELFEKINYCIIEKNTLAAEKINLKNSLSQGKRIRWTDSIRELSPVTGCILSNELVDNFAVHRVVMRDKLMEVFVDYRNGFIEVLRPAGENLNGYLDDLHVVLPEGMQTEINLRAIDWLKEIGQALKKGFVLTIDYGSSSSELYGQHRMNGTLLCYYKHTRNDSPYNNIGKQDITSHVNFSALRHWGLQHDLASCGITSQGYFLHGLGLADYIYQSERTADTGPGKEKILQMQALLRDMGNKFKVLIQHKGMQGVELSGLKFPLPMI